MKKRDFYQVHNIHPATPRKLLTELHKDGWVLRATARRLGVNIYYITQLVNNGQEPTDATENGREVRRRLFLKAYRPRPKVMKPPKLPPWLNPEALGWFVGQRDRVKQMNKDMKDEIKRRKK